MNYSVQDLSKYKNPKGFRGRSIIYVQLWWIVQATLFHRSPQFAYRFRAFLLRLFGAKIGRNVVIRPSATITYPWKVSIGDHSWIGDHVTLYSLGSIWIGDNTVISQGSYLCAGHHDYQKIDFPIMSGSIRIESEVWVAAQCFIAPNSTIGRGAVVGARSTVIGDLPPMMICYGTPAAAIKPRLKSAGI